MDDHLWGHKTGLPADFPLKVSDLWVKYGNYHETLKGSRKLSDRIAGSQEDNVNPGLINPCLLLWGCSPPKVINPTKTGDTPILINRVYKSGVNINGHPDRKKSARSPAGQDSAFAFSPSPLAPGVLREMGHDPRDTTSRRLSDEGVQQVEPEERVNVAVSWYQLFLHEDKDKLKRVNLAELVPICLREDEGKTTIEVVWKYTAIHRPTIYTPRQFTGPLCSMAFAVQGGLKERQKENCSHFGGTDHTKTPPGPSNNVPFYVRAITRFSGPGKPTLGHNCDTIGQKQ